MDCQYFIGDAQGDWSLKIFSCRLKLLVSSAASCYAQSNVIVHKLGKNGRPCFIPIIFLWNSVLFPYYWMHTSSLRHACIILLITFWCAILETNCVLIICSNQFVIASLPFRSFHSLIIISVIHVWHLPRGRVGFNGALPAKDTGCAEKRRPVLSSATDQDRDTLPLQRQVSMVIKLHQRGVCLGFWL